MTTKWTDPNMPGVLTTLGSDPSGDTRKVAYEVVKAAAAAGHPIYFVWGSGATGDHHAGLAIDFMVYDKGAGVSRPGPERPEVGRWVAEYVWENRERLGVRYEIFSRRIRSTTGTPPNVWLEYDGSDPHTNHVHVSRLAGARAYRLPSVVKKPNGSDWPSKGWATVSVKGDATPHLNGRVAPSTLSRIKHVRKDGFAIYYVAKKTTSEGVWVKTRYSTWYLIGKDLIRGRKVTKK